MSDENERAEENVMTTPAFVAASSRRTMRSFATAMPSQNALNYRCFCAL
jgi:hypothetical protein